MPASSSDARFVLRRRRRRACLANEICARKGHARDRDRLCPAGGAVDVDHRFIVRLDAGIPLSTKRTFLFAENERSLEVSLFDRIELRLVGCTEIGFQHRRKRDIPSRESRHGSTRPFALYDAKGRVVQRTISPSRLLAYCLQLSFLRYGCIAQNVFDVPWTAATRTRGEVDYVHMD